MVMADYPWQLDGFEKRMEFTGWPEWEGKSGLCGKYRIHADVMCASLWRWNYDKKDWSGDDDIITDHEAACLIREWWRGWLAERLIDVTWGENTDSGKRWYEAIYCAGRDAGCCPAEGEFDTYDAAQAAAIDAVMMEKGDEAN